LIICRSRKANAIAIFCEDMKIAVEIIVQSITRIATLMLLPLKLCVYKNRYFVGK